MITTEVGMVGDFIRDPRKNTLNPMTKFTGHMFAAVIDYAQQRDLRTVTLDEIFEYCYRLQNGISDHG
jgi:hypothetical protein